MTILLALRVVGHGADSAETSRGRNAPWPLALVASTLIGRVRHANRLRSSVGREGRDTGRSWRAANARVVHVCPGPTIDGIWQVNSMQVSPIVESQSLPLSQGAPLPARFTQTLFLQVVPLTQGIAVLQAEPSATGVTHWPAKVTESYWHLCGLRTHRRHRTWMAVE